MRIALFFFISVLVLVGGSALGTLNPQVQATVVQDCNCVSVGRIRGDNCGSPRSLRIEFRNVCNYSVNAQIYVRANPGADRQREGGPSRLGPGAASSYFWCQEPYEAIVACE